MMGYIWFGIIFVAMCVATVRGTMPDVTTQALDSAKASVTLAINLVGVMALFLGVMKVAQDAGLLKVIARLIRPLMVRLFPDVPPDHPAMGAMIMNMSANMLGLANAATPFGINAMLELDKLNQRKGTATNAMALFLAINTSNVTLLPTGVIAIRHAAGSMDAAGIVLTTLGATLCSTTVAIVVTKTLQRLPFFRLPAGDGDGTAAAPGAPAPALREGDDGAESAPDDDDGAPLEDLSGGGRGWVIASWIAMGLIGLCAIDVVIWVALRGVEPALAMAEAISPWIIPMLILSLLSYGLAVQLFDKLSGAQPRLEIYTSFIDGAKDGFNVALKIIPYLVAILVAVGMFRASGALDLLVAGLGPITGPLGLPAEALPMALLRPLSGSGAFGYMSEVVHTSGPDSYVGYLVSTMQGSTETTFYVVAVYFGAVQVSRLRHTIPAALTADLVGVIAAVVLCGLFFAGAS